MEFRLLFAFNARLLDCLPLPKVPLIDLSGLLERF